MRETTSTAAKEKVYLTRTFPLLQPLDGLSSITVRPLDLETALGLGDKPQYEDIIAAMTGLAAGQVDSLSYPDYTSLQRAAKEFQELDGYHLAGEKRDPKNFDITLFFSGDRIVRINLPTVGISKQADKIKDEMEKITFLIINLCDIDPDELDEMPLPDFITLRDAVHDFFMQPADYFQ